MTKRATLTQEIYEVGVNHVRSLVPRVSLSPLLPCSMVEAIPGRVGGGGGGGGWRLLDTARLLQGSVLYKLCTSRRGGGGGGGAY